MEGIEATEKLAASMNTLTIVGEWKYEERIAAGGERSKNSAAVRDRDAERFGDFVECEYR